MVKIFESLPAAIQVAQTVQGAADSVTPIAQNILASGQAMGATLATQADNLLFKLDAAGNMLIRAADSSYLSLDELMNGPLLPRVLELGNLLEKSEQLWDLSEVPPLAHLVDCKVDQLLDQLSPAERVQAALRAETYQLSGNVSVPPFAIGPDGNKVNVADLETMPLYPSVEERLAWSDRLGEAIRNDDKTLLLFCDLKDELLAARMSEAEDVQFWLAYTKHRPRTGITLPREFADASGRAWTLEQLKEQPLPAIVRTLKKWDEMLDAMGDQFEVAELAAGRARLVIEWNAIFQQMERLQAQLSDAELIQFCMS